MCWEKVWRTERWFCSRQAVTKIVDVEWLLEQSDPAHPSLLAGGCGGGHTTVIIKRVHRQRVSILKSDAPMLGIGLGNCEFLAQ